MVLNWRWISRNRTADCCRSSRPFKIIQTGPSGAIQVVCPVWSFHANHGGTMGNLGYPKNSWTFSRFNIFLWWQQNYILQSQNINILLHPVPKFPLQNGNIATYSSIKLGPRHLPTINYRLQGLDLAKKNLQPPLVHFPTIWWGLFCPERMPNHHSQPHCVPPTPRHTTRRLRLPPESWLKKLRKDLEKWRWVEFEPNPYGKKKTYNHPQTHGFDQQKRTCDLTNQNGYPTHCSTILVPWWYSTNRVQLLFFQTSTWAHKRNPWIHG